MKNNYFLHVLRSLPLLPLIYLQGKKIKKEITFLPEAKKPSGFVDINASKNLSILFVGESSFAGVGSELHENSFAGHFSRELSEVFTCNIRWKVYAKTGYNVSQMQRIILPQIRETSCDLMVIGIGGNDSFELTQPKKFQRSSQLLITDLQQKFPHTPILFVQLPTIEVFPAFTKEMKLVLGNHKDILADRLYRQVFLNKNVYFTADKINVQEWLSRLDEGETVSEFFSDGIHPSDLCYEMWAKDSVKILQYSKVDLAKKLSGLKTM